VDGVTDTCVSAPTLDGPKDTDAVESALEIVPPVVGETVCGGERPLPVFAVGSGGDDDVPVGVVELCWPVGVVVCAPTSTVIVPVPAPAPVAGGVAVVAGSGVVVDATAFELPVVVVVPGAVVAVPYAGTVTVCDPVVDEPEVPELEVPFVFVVDGTVRFGSVGASWLLETGGAAEVSVVVAGAVDVVFVEVVLVVEVLELLVDAVVSVEVDDVAVFTGAFSWALS
jgi:hypothetical protein